ncbi:MAG: O-antigen/teichoic acid export membrane protein, partial [Sulfurimonas sp.]
YLFMYSDIIILEKHVALSVIGIYAIADRFAQLLKTVVNSFSNAFNPIFMQASKSSIEEGQKVVYDTTKSWFVILGIGYIVLSHFGEYIIYIMTPQDYHEAALILPILSIAYVFRGIYILPINTFYFMKKTKYLPIATVISGVLNVLLNILLIPYIGIWGATITTTLSFAINWWLLEILSSKTFKVNFDKNAVNFLLVLIVVSNLLFYLVPNDNIYLRFIVQFVFVGGVILTVWFKDIGNIRKFIKTRLKR